MTTPTPLTEREMQVLQALADGCDRVGVARRLTVEPNTVKTHLRRIYQRLGARSAAHAVAIAMRQGAIR